MGTQNETLEVQADRLTDEALLVLGGGLLDEPDEYAEQCNYAGCYPWLAQAIWAHPHDSTILSTLHSVDAVEADTDYFC